MALSSLLNLQAPGGVLTSSRLRRVTDPISLTPSPEVRMRHFFEGVYDLSPTSHLSRFVKTLLGDAGIGYLTRIYIHARGQNALATMRYGDLDAFYGDVFGLRRMSWERTDPARYLEANTSAEWDLIDAKDASYRARIEAFSRAIGLGGTPAGLTGVASAMLGVEVKIYESYLMIDQADGPISPEPTPLEPRSYEQVEESFGYYRQMDNNTYADIEGQYGQIGRANVNDRAHFTIRPMRSITGEENYQLQRVLDRFRPVGTMMSIDPQGVPVHTPVKLRGASTDSTYWEVVTSVKPPKEIIHVFRPGTTETDPPWDLGIPAEGRGQAEAWSYNSDIVHVDGYREISEDSWWALEDPDSQEERIHGVPRYWGSTHKTPGLEVNYQRVEFASGVRDYHPAKAIADHVLTLQGRAASPGVVISSPVVTEHRVVDNISDSVVEDKKKPPIRAPLPIQDVIIGSPRIDVARPEVM